MPKKKTLLKRAKKNLLKSLKKLTPAKFIIGLLIIGALVISVVRFTPLFSNINKQTSPSPVNAINQTTTTKADNEGSIPTTSQTSASSSTQDTSGTTKQPSRSGQPSIPNGTSAAKEPSYTLGNAYGSFELYNASECKFVMTQNISGVGGDASVIFNVSTSPNMGTFGGNEVLSFSKTNYESKMATKTVYFNPPTSGDATVIITVNIVVKDFKGAVLRTGPTQSFKCPHAPYEYSMSDFDL